MLNIKQLRSKIEKIDTAIIKKLAERKRLSKKIGLLKTENQKQVVDKAREKKLMKFYETLCIKHQLQPIFVKRLFKIIITNSRRLQKKS